MAFDPNKYGATLVEDKPKFDPSKYGAVAVEKKPFTPISQIPTPPQGILANLPSAYRETKEKIAAKLAPKPIKGLAETFGGALATLSPELKAAQKSEAGLVDMNRKLAEKIIEKRKKGEDTTSLERQYERNIGITTPIEQIIPATQKTAKQVAGEALGTLEYMVLGARAPATRLGRLALGTTIGAGAGLKSSLEKEGATSKDILKGTGKGALIGLATSGILEGISAGLSKLSKTKLAERAAGTRYTKELAPPVKELSSDIEKGFKTFGEEASQVVDDAGKPVYVGGYRTMLGKAKNELADKGNKLISEARKHPNIQVSRNEVAGDIVEKMQNTYGRLDKNQLKKIQFEVSRIKATNDIEGLIKDKRMLDNLIPDSFWSKIDDPAQSFPSLVKYHLRDNIRKLINTKTADPVMQKLNNEMSIAMDIKKLAGSQIAKGQLKSGSFNRMIYDIVDDVIFNPAITTRIAQFIRGGYKPLTQLGQPIRTVLPIIGDKIINRSQ